MEKTKKPKGKVSHVAKKTPASKYITPSVYFVATEISSEEPEFLPVNRPHSHFADVFVLIPTLNHLNEQSLRLNHRATEVLDCGFKIKLPAGFRVRAEVNTDWARRGLLVSGSYVEDDKLKLIVVNIGHETPLVIPHRANIAHIWAEPVYSFDWKF